MRRSLLVAALAALLLVSACGDRNAEPVGPEGADAPGPPAEKPDAFALQAMAGFLFRPLSAEMTSDENPITDAKIDLGRMLYYEKRLSQYGDLSCNGCHDLRNYGTDDQITSIGYGRQRVLRNAPSTYNAALQIGQYWDGRAVSVESQARLALLNPLEVAIGNATTVEEQLQAMPAYAAAFAAAFPEDAVPVTIDNIARAIAAFERRMVTPSRFDDFLSGNVEALTDPELAGLQVFLDVGCGGCHGGMGIGGGVYQKLGAKKAYPARDIGRALVTRLEADKFLFKVPSLRNVAKTGPYLHDGSVASLDEAIRLMGEHQLGRALTEGQIADIRVFLGSLTGTIPKAYVAQPTMP
jgi:cytochrome c peroxidase